MTDWAGMTDEALVGSTLDVPEGDLPAFEELVRRHRGKVIANCRFITRATDEAQDLAQEVFVKAFFGLSGFDRRAAFTTWLHRIKVNHCLNFVKRRAGRETVSLDEPETLRRVEPREDHAGHAELLAEDERERVRGALEALPDSLRVPLVLCDMDGLSYQEIADALGIGLSAAKMRIKRGREEFRQRYASPPAPPPASPPAPERRAG